MFTSLCNQPALAQFVHFDPAICAHNTGYMYVALGPSVFATLPNASAFLDPLHPGEPHLRPPDPTEAVGCFGNPVQSDTYYLLSPAYLKRPVPGTTKLGIPDRLTLINLQLFTRGNGPGKQWVVENDERKVAEETCRSATVRETLPGGIAACRVRPKRLDVPEIDWAASYFVNPDTYTTPDGGSFFVNCGPGLFANGLDFCEVTYALSNYIGVIYRFRPHFTAYPVTINQIIAFDKSLRNIIESASVMNYPWPK